MTDKKTYAIFGGIMTLIILMSSGITYYIQDSGTKSSCSTGWNYLSEGKYSCVGCLYYFYYTLYFYIQG
jgi:hypothetical protein